jgi:hypothetical protein
MYSSEERGESEGRSKNIHLGLLLDRLAKELSLEIVLLSQVVKDGATLPDDKVVVLGIDEGGRSTLTISVGEERRRSYWLACQLAGFGHGGRE